MDLHNKFHNIIKLQCFCCLYTDMGSNNKRILSLGLFSENLIFKIQ